MRLSKALKVFVTVIMVFSAIVVKAPAADNVNAGIKANYVITEYNINIVPNIEDSTVKFDTDIALKATVDITSVNLYYDPVFKLENVEGVVGFKQSKDQIYIPINLKAGKNTVLKLHYSAQLKGIEYPGRQWNYVGREGFYFFQWWYPITQTTITQGYSEVVTMKIQVQTPAEWLIASYDVVKKTPAADKKYMIHQLEIRDPAFFYHIVCGPYTTFDVKDEKTKIITSFFGQKEYETFGKKIADEIIKELSFYETKFGTPAPQSYIIAQMPERFKQSVGEKGMLFIPSNRFADAIKKEKEGTNPNAPIDTKKEPQIYEAEFLAERVASSWWGGTVFGIGPEADYLNISLSKYSGMLYLEKRDGVEKLINLLREARVLFYDKVKPEEEVPLSTFVKEDLLDVYFKGKGPLVYHMLRQVVGESAFYNALKNYAGRFAGKFSTLGDLTVEMEKASGKKLSWFFDQWVKQTGRMTYDIDFTQLPGEKPYRFKIKLENKGSIKMPFRIDITFEDMTSDQFEWTTDYKETERVMTSNKKPVGAKINSPEGYMLNDNSRVNSLLNGPLNNFFFLSGNFLIVEGTLQGNEAREKAVKDRTLLYTNIFKKEFKTDVKVVRDDQVTQDDLKNYNIVCIGCSGCNRVLAYFESRTPINYVKYMLGSKDPFILGDDREGAYFCPNPDNPWRGLLADEFFSSKDNYDPHKLPYDFYVRNLGTGEHMKGYFHKFNVNGWRPPVVPMFSWPASDKSNIAEMFENVFNLSGSCNDDFEVTYNPKNFQVFGTKTQKDFVAKGDFEKPITVLRGPDFLTDTIIVEASTEMATYKRIFKYDFRGETEPPTMTFKNAPKSVPSGQDYIVDWEGRDNETYAADLKYAWKVDGGALSPFARGARATFKGLKPGRHNIKFYVMDKRGNLNYSTPTVVFDVAK